MNKKIVTISLCISIILYGNTIDTNKIENLQPNIQKKETHTQENLDYLLEDSDTKFPVSDYIWQKGQQKQNIDKYFKDTQKRMEGEIVGYDKDGNPIFFKGYDKDGKPIYVNSKGELVDKNGKPILGKDGKPLKFQGFDKDGNAIITNSKGELVDKDGKPILGKDGKPIKFNGFDKDGKAILTDSNGLLVDSNGNYILDKEGKPIKFNGLDKDGNPILTNSNGELLDSNGNVILGSDGKPIKFKGLDKDGNPIYVNSKGELVDKNGKPILGKDGKPLKFQGFDKDGNAIITNSKGELVDKDGKPILGKDGKPIKFNGFDKDGNPIFTNSKGEIVDKDGNLILDANGNPIKLDVGGQIELEKERVKREQERLKKEEAEKKAIENIAKNQNKGGKGGGAAKQNTGKTSGNTKTKEIKGQNPKGKIVGYDKDGNPIYLKGYDKDGNPIYTNERGELVDKDGNPILDANGNPIIFKGFDENGNPIYTNENGELVDKNGKPILDENGNPIKFKGFDKNGKAIYTNSKGQLVDKNGRIIRDKNGNPIYMHGFDENGNPILSTKTLEELREQNYTKQAMADIYGELREDELALNQNGDYRFFLEIMRGQRGQEIKISTNKDNKEDSKEHKRIYGDSKFSNQENIDEATHEHALYRTILAGELLPAILLTPISSDIEAPIRAKITRNIYAEMGDALLIPEGSKLIGFYTNDNKTGQNRMKVVWREIVTPDGVNIILTNAVTGDSEGYAGVKGYLNNKFWQRYGIAITASTLTNIGSVATASALAPKGKGGVGDTNSGGIASALMISQILGKSQEELNDSIKELSKELSKVRPTIEVKAGTKIYIITSTNIWFPEPNKDEIMDKYFRDK